MAGEKARSFSCRQGESRMNAKELAMASRWPQAAALQGLFPALPLARGDGKPASEAEDVAALESGSPSRVPFVLPIPVGFGVAPAYLDRGHAEGVVPRLLSDAPFPRPATDRTPLPKTPPLRCRTRGRSARDSSPRRWPTSTRPFAGDSGVGGARRTVRPAPPRVFGSSLRRSARPAFPTR